MGRRMFALASAAALVLAPTALVLAPAAMAAPAQPSVQQQFEAGATALDLAHWQEALDTFVALQARVSPGATRSLAIVKLRKARALEALGRDDEAAANLREGLAALPADDPSLAEDRYVSLVTLGDIAQRSLDYGEALERFRSALPLMKGVRDQSRALRGMILTSMFFDAPAALAEADAAIAEAAALQPPDKHLESLFRILRGRVLLNMGRAAEAKKELEHANQLLGGLTERVDASDIAVRSDLAIASLLSGDEEAAREYMAWTGAGHLREGFPRGASMDPPPCGDALKPDDVAVIEFWIKDDGSVGAATPIYSSRQGASALAFARAVSGWSWSPTELAKIAPLFRAMTRVEMRCSNESKRPSVQSILGGDLERWLASRGFEQPDFEGRSDAANLKPLRAALAQAEAKSSADSLALVPILALLASNAIIPREEAIAYLARGEAIVRREKAPAPVLAWFEIQQIDKDKRWRRDTSERYAAGLKALADSPEIAADPRALTAVRLELADALYQNKHLEEATAVLQRIGTAPGLDLQDSLRAAGLARLASLQLVAGDAAAARATYQSSGLTAAQCSLLDSAPRRKAGGFSDNDFPMEAFRWGFEGWVKIEFDLSAAGETINVRPTVAYPPFVFEKAGSKLVDRLRYEQSFRPDGSLGCGGLSQNVGFVLPDR